MSKFICLCGITFNNQKESDQHVKIYEDIVLKGDFSGHKVFKQRWQARLASWFWDYNWEYTFRFFGVFLVYCIALNHFKIELGWIESIGVGIGLGLAIKKD